MKKRNILIYSTILLAGILSSCNNGKQTEEKTINPYCIIEGDTIAHMFERNDSLKTAKIIMAKNVEKVDSVFLQIYKSCELNGLNTNIYEKTGDNEDTLCILALGKDAEIIAKIETASKTDRVIRTINKIENDSIICKLANDFNLSRAKFFLDSTYTASSPLDYYALCNQENVTFFDKPFTEDTERILKYFSHAFEHMLYTLRYENIGIYIRTEEKVLEYAMAMRDMGEFAKRNLKNPSTQKAAKQVIDSLNYYQKHCFRWLRGRYEEILFKELKDYKVTVVNIDPFEDVPELYLSSSYFVIEDMCIKVITKRDNIIRLLGIKSIRFNWSQRAYLDHVFPVRPPKEIHADDYIGWLPIMKRTRTTNNLLNDIYKIYPQRYFKE